MRLIKLELGHAIIWKVATCQRITSKNTPTQWVDTWARDTVRRYWSADTLFWQLLIDQNMDVQYREVWRHITMVVLFLDDNKTNNDGDGKE